MRALRIRIMAGLLAGFFLVSHPAYAGWCGWFLGSRKAPIETTTTVLETLESTLRSARVANPGLFLALKEARESDVRWLNEPLRAKSADDQRKILLRALRRVLELQQKNRVSHFMLHNRRWEPFKNVVGCFAEGRVAILNEETASCSTGFGAKLMRVMATAFDRPFLYGRFASRPPESGVEKYLYVTFGEIRRLSAYYSTAVVALWLSVGAVVLGEVRSRAQTIKAQNLDASIHVIQEAEKLAEFDPEEARRAAIEALAVAQAQLGPEVSSEEQDILARIASELSVQELSLP